MPIGQGWANARGCPLRPHFQNQSCHKAQFCQAHVRHCRLVTNTHPALSKFADSPHFISRDRVPVATARRWQFANLNWAVSELHWGMTQIHHLMQMKRPAYCKDNKRVGKIKGTKILWKGIIKSVIKALTQIYADDDRGFKSMRRNQSSYISSCLQPTHF